jgi:hypothetical protein
VASATGMQHSRLPPPTTPAPAPGRHVVRAQQRGANGAVEVLFWGEHAESEVGEAGIKAWIEQVGGRKGAARPPQGAA